MNHDIVRLEAHGQRLAIVPALGGRVAEWSWQGRHLWRPWDRVSDDRYSLASFAMLPWSNRIGRGGFEHAGRWHAVRPNRIGEPYPIHGDGWLQPWTCDRSSDATAELHLASRGDPYHCDAVQRFELHADGLMQTVAVSHRGADPMPYGLGLHPWFPRTPLVTVQANVDGVWRSGADPMPTAHSDEFPATWDLNPGAPMSATAGPLVDNAYSGWDGRATIHWPERKLTLHLESQPGYCLVYRPPDGCAFCFEPVTHPIDAFHLPGRPGLVELQQGQTLMLTARWRIDTHLT